MSRQYVKWNKSPSKLNCWVNIPCFYAKIFVFWLWLGFRKFFFTSDIFLAIYTEERRAIRIYPSKNIDILTGKCIAKKVRQRDSVSAFSTHPTFCARAQRHLPGEMARTRRQHLMVELLMLPRHLWTQLTAESAIGARDAFFKGPYWGCNRPLSPPMPLSLLWN